MRLQPTITYALLVGLGLGVAGYHGVLSLAGLTPMSGSVFEELQQKDEEPSDELFRTRSSADIDFNQTVLPYDEQADAAAMVKLGRNQARAEQKFLMVTFGANWCLDCRTLHRHLNSEAVSDYTRELFQFVNVDVGQFNKNSDVAESVGVSLTRGIPVAVFFGPDGNLIGATNEGQLEPSRYYSSKQILKFVRDVVERQRITAPDSVH